VRKAKVLVQELNSYSAGLALIWLWKKGEALTLGHVARSVDGLQQATIEGVSITRVGYVLLHASTPWVYNVLESNETKLTVPTSKKSGLG